MSSSSQVSSSQVSSAQASGFACNVVALRGVLSRPPSVRALRDGRELLELDVTVRSESGAETVNVSWEGAAPSGVTWGAGEELVVVGRVRRRFYRSGPATRSQTEVVASLVVPARQAKRAGNALAAAAERISPRS